MMKDFAYDRDSIYLDLFDLNDEIRSDEKRGFQDEGHLNDNGSAKVAAYLNEYIINHGIVQGAKL